MSLAAVAEPIGQPTSLDEIVRSCSNELFAAYGVVATDTVTERGPTEFAFAAIIGFTGTPLRGTLLVTMTKATLESSNPIPGSPPREWIAELSNQLLGRVKTQLLSCGVEIYVSTPLVLRGQHLAPEALRVVSPIELNTATGPVIVWMESESPEGFQLVRQTSANDIPSEGDSFMF